MDEVLGLIDALEALIVEAKRIPMTQKLVLEEEPLLRITNKMRDVIKTKGAIIKKEVVAKPRVSSQQINEFDNVMKNDQQAKKILTDAYAQVEIIQKGSQRYADEVLSNLQLILTKTESDMRRIKKTIENGRELLEEKNKVHALSVQNNKIEKKEISNETKSTSTFTASTH